ncbi:MAG: prolipoprotein diacylglyceryl transferase [Dehalococcoidales bacterium]|nr:prolipoprotein diacylglyceryl transferase [Dehalococcoidales bacterium]
MNGIIININPVAFQIGQWEMRWYPLMIMVAIVAALGITLNQAVKRGVKKEQIIGLLPWLLVAGIIGARAAHVIDRWDYYRGNLAAILAIQQGGLAIWGAVAGGALATVIFARVNRIKMGRLFDVLVPGLIAAQIIGRIGCIINGDAYGDPTSLPWGFIYNNPGAMIPEYLKGIPTQPYPVYEMLWNGLALGVLLWLRKKLKIDGSLFLVYLIFYAIGRFILTFVREEKIWLWGLQEAQLISVAVIMAAIVTMYIQSKKQVREVEET